MATLYAMYSDEFRNPIVAAVDVADTSAFGSGDTDFIDAIALRLQVPLKEGPPLFLMDCTDPANPRVVGRKNLPVPVAFARPER